MTSFACQQSAPLQTKATVAPKPVAGRVLQRKCACGNTAKSHSECPECKKKLQRRAANSELGPRSDSSVPPIVNEVLRSSGHPLDPATRAFMESRFARDFSHVRVHADDRASESARAVNALAYTVGSDVVFGAGLFSPETHAGRRLLAHELAHVVQQSRATCSVSA